MAGLFAIYAFPRLERGTGPRPPRGAGSILVVATIAILTLRPANARLLLTEAGGYRLQP